MSPETGFDSASHALMAMAFCTAAIACSSARENQVQNTNPSSGGASASTTSTLLGGSSTIGGAVGAGGSISIGGTSNVSQTTRTTGSALGGNPSTGGVSGSTNALRTGGTRATGGASGTPGTVSTGGAAPAGGNTGTSTGNEAGTGTTLASGGSTSNGGSTATRVTTPGGSTGVGGTSAIVASGGVPPTGGTSALGSSGTLGTGGNACPSTSTLKAGDNRSTLQFGGRSRSYVAYVPTSVKAGSPVPLVFDFHGHSANAAQEESSSGWKQKADQFGFIVVYPEGVDSSWNVGSCCGLAMSENVDDVGFTKAILEAVRRAACIDTKRVYATGMSNGAGFTHRLGCEAADVLAAIAPASADLVTEPCTPSRPISELSIRGLSDTMVAYEGGKTGSTGWYSPGAKKTLELWKAIDECTGSVTTSHQYCESYTSCAAGVEITLCSLPNTGHDTYNNAVGFKVPDIAWEMFQRQTMP